MGQTCSACQGKSDQKNANTQKQEITHAIPQLDHDQKENAVQVVAVSKGPNGAMTMSKQQSKKKLPTSQKKLEKQTTMQLGKGAEEVADIAAENENPTGKKKNNEMASFASKSMTKSRPVKELVKLAEMPDFFNPLTKEKKDKLPPFEYSRPEFEVMGAEYQCPIQFGSTYAYQGQWKDGKKSGRGTQIWRDGSYYEGYWKDNMASGFGRLIHTGGDVYQGQWKEDRAEGFGQYRHICGAVFRGNWKSDKQEGYGEEIWSDNAVYKGQYKDGSKYGKGKFEWSDGSFYEGEFVDNSLDGYGQYHWNDGKIYIGTWKQNKMEGKGVFTWADGRKYEGQYKNDKKHGLGTFDWPDGRQFEGQWAEGKQHGKGKYRNKKGAIRQGLWQNGTRVKWIDEGSNKYNSTINQ